MKIPDLLAQLSPQQRKMAIAGAVALVLLVWGWLAVLPQWKVISTAGPELVKLKAQIREVRQGIARMPEMSEKHRVLQTSLKAHPKQLVQERLPELLDEIAALAKANGVLVQTVRPMAIRETRSSVKSKSGAAQPESVVLPIEIIGQAGYHDVGRFTDALESAPQLYRIQRMVVTADRRDELHPRVSMAIDAYIVVTSL